MYYAIAISAIGTAFALVALLISLGSAARLNAMGANAPLRSVRKSGLGAGAIVPVAALSAFKSLNFELTSDPTLVFFTSGSCSACQSLLDNLQHEDLGRFKNNAIVVNIGPIKHRETLQTSIIPIVPNGADLVSLFEISSFPSWALVNAEKIIAEGVGNELGRIVESAELGLTRVNDHV